VQGKWEEGGILTREGRSESGKSEGVKAGGLNEGFKAGGSLGANE
jgi:hypothetical protein